MTCKERHFTLTDTFTVCTVTATVEGMKGHAFHVYRTADGPFSKRIVQGWSAGTVREAIREATFLLNRLNLSPDRPS